jgi:hypothetical protein
VARREGLRGSTRARALRAGGDDFVTTDTSPVEVLERIDAATGRGIVPGRRRLVAPARPAGDGRTARRASWTATSCGSAGPDHGQPTPPLFAVILLRPTAGSERAWALLRDQVRLEDGDMVAHWADGQLAVYLGHVDPGTASTAGHRLAESHDGPVDLLRFPADREEIEDRLGVIAPGPPRRPLRRGRHVSHATIAAPSPGRLYTTVLASSSWAS